MLIVGIGGTTRPASTSETALRVALQRTTAARDDVDVKMFTSEQLDLPLYNPSGPDRTADAVALVEALRAADGVVLSSPAYHGSVSGLVKNALDYIEYMRWDERPYLDGLPVGCIAVAYGWQAAVSTLRTLRDIVHALRGWPTPFGVSVNARDGALKGGECHDADLLARLELVAGQVLSMAVVREQGPISAPRYTP